MSSRHPSRRRNGSAAAPVAAPSVVVGIGASAGGIEALRRLIGSLPADLPAAILVVVHISPSARSVLPQLLDRSGGLHAAHAIDREPLLAGRIYVAPPNRHLLVQDGVIRLSEGPRDNRSRPAVDPLFRSVASEYGPRSLGVVLSGLQQDGALGLAEIKAVGGAAYVQEPSDAHFPPMPEHAIRAVRPDLVAKAEDLGAAIAEQARSAAVTTERPPSRGKEVPQAVSENGAGNDRAAEQGVVADDGSPSGAITSITCPDCGGTLWAEGADEGSRFRCRVGHAYSGDSLLEAQAERMEDALWGAVVALLERADLLRRVGARMDVSDRWESEALEAEQHADVLRSLVSTTVRTVGSGPLHEEPSRS